MISGLEEGIRAALELARGIPFTEIPIAAIIVNNNGFEVVSGVNSVYGKSDTTAHAEMEALRALGSLVPRWERSQLTMFVNLEPCPMCAWAVRVSGIGKLVFGAPNPKYGAAGSVFDLLRDGNSASQVEVIGGIVQRECEESLASFWGIIRHTS